ncbi:hypothetical protein MNBD_BACTEROID01-1929 [hydrothermal vent metagenome]|uniref:Uncharacterized protein n=1 Tax=hydrothermal vent metagenome TaxID=652676 RepID=A0A3B0USZ9_9ZZZZ
MKTIKLIFSMVVFIAFSGYSQNTDIKGLLDKPETRTEIFNAIVGDHGLMMELMKTMQGNEHAMMMMKGNNQMMKADGKMEMKGNNQMMESDGKMGMKGCKQMMKSDGKMEMKGCKQMMKSDGKMGMKGNNQMMGMMKNNPEMMQEMMSSMMDICEQDSTMRCNMANMITKHPKMMKMITQKISPEKVTGNNGGMQMMHKKGDNE